jgi:hypothetical protein
MTDGLLFVAYESQGVVEHVRRSHDLHNDPAGYVEALLASLRDPAAQRFTGGRGRRAAFLLDGPWGHREEEPPRRPS